MKKILISLLLASTILLVGCEQITGNTSKVMCDRAQTCLHLVSGGETYTSVKNPDIQATAPGLIIFFNNNEKVAWTGEYMLVTKN